jgi:hypothetical protein
MPKFFCCFFQEQSSTSTGTPAVNPEWANYQVFGQNAFVIISCFYYCQAWILIHNSLILQAYSPIPPPGYMASSPQAHPYMWGVQVIVTYIIFCQSQFQNSEVVWCTFNAVNDIITAFTVNSFFYYKFIIMKYKISWDPNSFSCVNQ